MAISIFDVQENKVSSDLSSYAIYLYGPPKSGKTTFASQMPQPLILAAEIGYKAIPGVKAIDVSTWADIKKVIRELKDPRAKDLFKTIVFDTLDLTGGMCEKYICQQNGVEALKEITWGAGWGLMKKEFESVVNEIRRLGYSVIFISHSKDKTFKPKDGEEYNQITQTCGSSLNDIAKNASDIIAYIDMTANGERKLVLRSLDNKVDAGCRFKKITPVIDFSYEALTEAVEKAIEEEAKETNNKYLTEEKATVTSQVEFDFEGLMNTFQSTVTKLMKTDPTFYQPKIVAITNKVLGKGKKVAELEESQAELLSIIVDEVVALAKDLKK